MRTLTRYQTSRPTINNPKIVEKTSPNPLKNPQILPRIKECHDPPGNVCAGNMSLGEIYSPGFKLPTWSAIWCITTSWRRFPSNQDIKSSTASGSYTPPRLKSTWEGISNRIFFRMVSKSRVPGGSVIGNCGVTANHWPNMSLYLAKNLARHGTFLATVVIRWVKGSK